MTTNTLAQFFTFQINGCGLLKAAHAARCAETHSTMHAYDSDKDVSEYHFPDGSMMRLNHATGWAASFTTSENESDES